MRIRTELTLLTMLLILVATSVFSVVLYHRHKTALIDGLDAQLLTAATFAEATLPPGYHDRIRDETATSPDEFSRVVRLYNQHCRRLGLQYLWSVLVLDDRVVFTSATSASLDDARGDHAAFFETHSDPEAFAIALWNMWPTYSTFHNEWGDGRMVLVPKRDAHGRVYMFGASISLAEVNRLVHQTVTRSVLTGGALLLLGFIGCLAFARSLSRPIESLHRAAQVVGEGNYDQKFAAGGSKEIEALSTTLNSVCLSIREHLTSLEASEERERRLNAKLRDQVAELGRLSALKDEFLANTSHELRTPLAGIIGLTEGLLVQRDDTPLEERRQSLELVVHSARHLGNLVDDILDHSRLKHSDIELSPRSIDLRSAAETVVQLLRPTLRDRPVEIENVVSSGVPPVSADQERLQQILFNLLGNAIKFTDEGRITVSARERDETVEVSVHDTGIGIEQAALERIFEPFEQVDGTATRSHGGTGLGLSVTRALVELHGGRVWATSELGKGSTFWFTLPRSSEPPVQTSPGLRRTPVADLKFPCSPRKEAAESADRQGVVLAVDDEPALLSAVELQLQDAFTVLRASSGGDALDRLQERDDIDLVLLDVMMPGKSGIEVLGKIREHRDASMLPVILLTAKNRVGDLIEGFQHGANDYLVKPFSREELLARVKLHVALRRELQRSRERERELSESLEVNQLLLLEVNHRVRNSLQLIQSVLSMQEARTDNPEALQALRASQDRVFTMALVHSCVHGAGQAQRVSLSRFLDRLVEALRSNQKGPTVIDTAIEVEDTELDLSVLAPLAFVLTECLTNSYRHAFPTDQSGQVRIRTSVSDSRLCVEISDTGVGIPLEILEATPEPLGLLLIRAMARQLRADLRIEANGGTSVVLEVPLAPGQSGDFSA